MKLSTKFSSRTQQSRSMHTCPRPQPPQKATTNADYTVRWVVEVHVQARAAQNVKNGLQAVPAHVKENKNKNQTENRRCGCVNV